MYVPSPTWTWARPLCSPFPIPPVEALCMPTGAMLWLANLYQTLEATAAAALAQSMLIANQSTISLIGTLLF